MAIPPNSDKYKPGQPGWWIKDDGSFTWEKPTKKGKTPMKPSQKGDFSEEKRSLVRERTLEAKGD